MVARLLRLRLALLGGVFRGSFARGARRLLMMVVLAAAAVGLAMLPPFLASGPEHLAQFDTVIGGVLLALIFVVPFFTRGRMLSVRQFAALPVRPGNIAFSLLITTVLTWPFLLLLVWLVSLSQLRPEWSEPSWLIAGVTAVAALLALTGARFSAGLSYLLVGEQRAGRVRAVGWLLLLAALPVSVFAVSNVLVSMSTSASTLGELARVLSWTPFGAPFEAAHLAAAGQLDDAMTHFGIASGAVLVLLLLWLWIAKATCESVERPHDPGAARTGLGWFERFAARPAPAIAARGLTYWSRDPRYRVALFAIPFAPFVMLAALWVAGVDVHVLALIPLPVIMFLFGWSQHNDVAMDSTAIWMHVVSGTRGRADRTGRLLPVMIIGVPVALIGSSLTVTLMGDWRLLPAVFGLNVGILFTAAASTSVFSVLMPYPVTRPGDSPFAQPQWQGSGSGTSQTLSVLTALVLAVPVVWASVIAIVNVDFVDNLIALGVGVGWGLAVLGLGILIGGWIFDRSGPELIAVTQVFD